MKKSVFTLFAIAFVLFGNVTNANAQNQVITTSSSYNYNHVRENVLKGDDNYRSGAYTTAMTFYQWALRDNGSCGGNKYISDAELNRKLDDCRFAVQHHMTREQYNREQSDASTKQLVSAIANAFSKNSNSNTQNTQTTSADDSEVLRHFTNDGISYDASFTHTKVTKVEKTANATIVHFEYINMKNVSMCLSISSNIYIKDRTNDQKYTYTNSDGIYNKKLTVEAGDSHDFTITFPAVSENCHEIDIVDPNGYKFYHVKF